MAKMKKGKMVLLCFMMSFACLSSCYYDVESELFPYSVCNTNHVTFGHVVLPILQRSCFSCHNKANAPYNGNVRLESYEDVLSYVQNGQLMGSLLHESGYEPMPQDAQQLNDCEISKIGAWVADGAPEN